MPTNGHRLMFHSDLTVDIEPQTWPDPVDEQVLIRVEQSQVSAGSEINFYRHHPASGPRVSTQLGYMTVGHVQAIGENVQDISIGDRVLTSGYHATHHLLDLGKRHDLRQNPVNYLQKLDDRVSNEAAGFSILGDVALHGLRRAEPQIDESVVVFGCGIVGQLTIQLARVAGCYPIIAVDLVDSRLAQARISGATHTINSSVVDPIAAVRELTNGIGAEILFHCAPVANILQLIMECAAERAKVILTASAPGIAEIGLQVELMRRELSIIGVYEFGIDHPIGYWRWTRSRNRLACMRLFASGEMRIDHLMSHVVPYTEAESIFRMMSRGGDDWLGIAFNWRE